MAPRMGGYVPADHVSRHQDGGRDEISLADLDGETVNLAAHKLVLDAHMPDFSQILRTGEYMQLNFPVGTSLTPTLVADRLTAYAIFLPRPMTFDRLMMEITSEIASTGIRIGIYVNGTNLYPGALLIDGGAISANAVAEVAATISQQLAAGIYWMADLPEAGPTVRALAGGFAPLGLKATAPSTYQLGWFKNTVAYGALPDPFPSGATKDEWTGGGSIARVFPRLLSLD